MTKLSFSALADEAIVPTVGHVNNVTTEEFKKLKDRGEGSKAELVMVGVRMTKAERRQLRAMAGQLEIPIQDIVREGISLFRAKQGVR